MNKSNTELSKTTVEWKNIPWRKIERAVFKLQKRIFKAAQRGDHRAVRRHALIPTVPTSDCYGMMRVIRSQGAGFYKSQHKLCELSYKITLLLKHPLRERRLSRTLKALTDKKITVVIDETGDRQKGKKTDYVSRQYPSCVTLRKLLPFLNSRAFIYEAIARFFPNNKYSDQVFIIG